MLQPLSTIDAALGQLGITAGFVFASPPSNSTSARTRQIERVELAVRNVRNKWALLKGVVVEADKGKWAVDLNPATTDDQRPSFFTISTVHTPYHLAIKAAARLPTLSSLSSCSVLPSPHLSHFRHASTPKTLEQYAKIRHSILSVHCTLFDDAVAVGLSSTHGVFDVVGFGMVIAFLNDELHGRDWTPPLPFSVNSVTLALKALHKMPPPPAEVEASFPPVVEGWVSPNSVGNVARFLSSVLCETFWHRSELRYAFLPKRAVEKLVERTKAEVKQETNGEEWVSTGDVLLAWALKAAHSDENTSSASLSASAVLEARPLLSHLTPTPLSNYPHNAASSYSFSRSPLPLSDLATTPVSALALAHRRMLNDVRTAPYLRAVALAEKEKTSGGKYPLLPKRDWPELLHLLPFFGHSDVVHSHRWVVSNQMAAGRAELRLPSCDSTAENDDLPLIHYLAAVVPPVPLVLDHVLGFQQGNDGVGLIASMRQSRWKSLVRALGELDQE